MSVERQDASATAVERKEVLSGDVERAQPPKPPQIPPEVLRREIAETRDDLADALSSLMEKTDVRARAGQQLTDAKNRAIAQIQQRKATIASAAAGITALAVASAVAVMMLRRRRAQEPSTPRLKKQAYEAMMQAREAQDRARAAEMRDRDAAWKRARRSYALAQRARAKVAASKPNRSRRDSKHVHRDEVQRWAARQRSGRV